MSAWRERVLLSAKRNARRIGVELARYNATNSLDAQRARLLEVHDVDLVVDVGANAGQWASILRKTGYEGRIVSFEPLAEARSSLARVAARDPRWTCRPEAVSSHGGEARLHVAANSVSSSLLPMEERHVEAAPGSAIVEHRAVATVRLDEVGLDGDRILLKLDVQGAELDALVGAERMLASIVLVELELSFEPLYTGGPLWREVTDHLKVRGYDVAALRPSWVDEGSGRLLQADAIFTRA